MGNIKHYGVAKLILGALLLLNAFVWPKWVGFNSEPGWISFFAVLMLIGGLVKVFWPCKGNSCPPEPTTKRKKRKKR